MNLSFTYASVDIDETPLPNEAATDMVLRLATRKARAGSVAKACDRPVLAADTAVVVGERAFGKPSSQRNALEMLNSLSDNTHEVVTGVAVMTPLALLTTVSVTAVEFRKIHPDEARAYWESGEPEGKAGGYAVQGLGGVFVRSIVGSYSGVVGLPVYETAALLQQVGVNFVDLAASSRSGPQ